MNSTAISEFLEANGVGTIPPCTYKFPYTDAKSFVDTANKVTTMGIGAYMGAIKVTNHDVCISIYTADTFPGNPG